MPSVLIGIPLGAYVIRRMDAETFRRVCMSFDVWVVGFGLSRALMGLKLVQSPGRLQRHGGGAARSLSSVQLLPLAPAGCRRRPDMYTYDPVDQKIVDQRVAQFRDQTRRFLAGKLTEEEFRALRLE